MLVSVFNEKQIVIPMDLNRINYRYMDGNEKNRKHCKGYCNFNMHKGFMDQKMVAQHQCHEKECDFFFQAIDEMYSEISKRRREEKRERKNVKNRVADILAQCNRIAEEFEGIKATAVKEKNGHWVIEYIALFGTDPHPFQKKLSEIIGEIEMVEKECDFETAERIYLAN